MRTLLLVVLFGAACAKTPPPGFTEALPPAPHDLQCPEGSIPLGAAPPMGLDAYCARTLPDGTRLRTGPSITWHAEGVKASEGAWYDDGKRGEWTTWHPNGQIHTEEHWRDGKQHGTHVEFDANGQKRVEGSYLGGEPDGPWSWWDDQGRVERTGQYVNAQKDGEWLEFWPDGRTKSRRVFREGRQLQQQSFPEQGTTITVPTSGG